MSSGAQWHQDPTGRHQLRYWDGTLWTDHVANNGVTSMDPVIPETPTSVAATPSISGQWVTPEAAHGEVTALQAELAQLSSLLVETRDAVLLQEVGLYVYRHPLDDSTAYKGALDRIRSEMRQLVRAKAAVNAPKNWTVGGSARAGTKMIGDLSKLVLRAFNNEADNLVRSMKPYALEASVERLDKAGDAICRFVSIVDLTISPAYRRLRVQELELTADYLSKREHERERERAKRDQAKEEAQARKEFEATQANLTRELDKRRAALDRLLAGGAADHAAVDQLQAGIDQVQSALDGVIDRLANVRAGHVYVISNFGSFGERIVKIGMTRRLDPLDRVRELGDASVPFRYDVHALVFSEDAVGLETALHRRFASRRVNLVNYQREFFHATPAEVREAMADYLGSVVVEFNDDAEALEWRQSVNERTDSARATPARS